MEIVRNQSLVQGLIPGLYHPRLVLHLLYCIINEFPYLLVETIKLHKMFPVISKFGDAINYITPNCSLAVSKVSSYMFSKNLFILLVSLLISYSHAIYFEFHSTFGLCLFSSYCYLILSSVISSLFSFSFCAFLLRQGITSNSSYDMDLL